MRIATIDAGTNTVLLLITESDEKGKMRVLEDAHAIARLGEGVDERKAISREAFERFQQVLREHQQVIDRHHCQHVKLAATSAMRDAANAAEVASLIKAEFGYEIEIITGAQEAQLTYRGSLVGLDHPEKDVIGVLDIGGGSTEVSFGTMKHFVRGVSMQLGAVRLTERFLSEAPFKNEAVTQATVTVSQAIHGVATELAQPDHLVAVAGTPTSLAAMKLGLTEFDAKQVNGTTLSMQDVERFLGLLLTSSTAELLARYPVINKARADILPAGTLILYSVMRMLKASEVRVSTRGLRYGLAIRDHERHYVTQPILWQIEE
jgi:exopolyphosphatase / guanosine-5'-triphosphate,3'-diphosphate pyrophosphatase